MLELWIGGILDADIADCFPPLRNALETAVNTALQGHDYGDALGSWDVVLAVQARPPREHVRYNARTKETDVRVVIDYPRFARASKAERADLLAAAVLTSIHRLQGKRIADVDFDRLEQDVAKALGKV